MTSGANGGPADPGLRLPRLVEIARRRPIAMVAEGDVHVQHRYLAVPEVAGAEEPTPHVAPCAAVEVELDGLARDGVAEASLAGAGGSRLVAHLDVGAGQVGLTTTLDGATKHHRSRRHGKVASAPSALAVTLTGSRLTAFTREDGAWVARAWVGLRDLLDVHDSTWVASLRSGWSWAGTGHAPVTGWRAGGFGQLGLRDVRLVTTEDGAPYTPRPGVVLFTATSAGPGFFDTAHTSIWQLDRRHPSLHHVSDVFFTRPDRPGVFGDHATHLVRRGTWRDGSWLVATSTWGDFDPARRDASVAVTVAETDADLLHAPRVVEARPLTLPVRGRSVGAWDPHLVRDGDRWLVGYVSATRFFEFHPVLAAGPSLEALELVGAAPERRATEGTTLLRGLAADGRWLVAASDGPDSRRAHRGRYPLFEVIPDADGRLVEVGTLDAPYPTNIPWPTLVPPDQHTDAWLMVTFDGTPAGGDLLGYGTHGDLVVLREAPASAR